MTTVAINENDDFQEISDRKEERKKKHSEFQLERKDKKSQRRGP